MEGVGPVTARKLIAYSGGAASIFSSKKSSLLKIPGIGESTVQNILSPDLLIRAEKELRFIAKNNIQTFYFLDENYPRRLKEIEDSPIVLFGQGALNLDADRILSVVGTRRATEYGKAMTQKIIAELAVFNPLILSGLAYGIDIAAHKAALDNGLQTVGVVGHGLDTVYPSLHKPIADKMVTNGGLVSAFTSHSKMDPGNFPDRNKIVASMTDAVLVVEAGISGGALITANMAFGYNKDVMAIPGRTVDEYSVGCNGLIKRTKAHLVESAADICYVLGWELEKSSKKAIQKQLFVEMTENEQRLFGVMQAEGQLKIDMLALKSGFNLSQTSATLFNMELKGLVKCLPGTIYTLV
jgi:DNA processing protein